MSFKVILNKNVIVMDAGLHLMPSSVDWRLQHPSDAHYTQKK